MSCFDEICSKLLDQKKEAKLQWLQAQSEINWNNLNNAAGVSGIKSGNI
jgi:hypothetical protein